MVSKADILMRCESIMKSGYPLHVAYSTETAENGGRDRMVIISPQAYEQSVYTTGKSKKLGIGFYGTLQGEYHALGKSHLAIIDEAVFPLRNNVLFVIGRDKPLKARQNREILSYAETRASQMFPGTLTNVMKLDDGRVCLYTIGIDGVKSFLEIEDLYDADIEMVVTADKDGRNRMALTNSFIGSKMKNCMGLAFARHSGSG
jgi:hypothetical protein